MRIPAIVLLLHLLAACGQSGDLYLPVEKPAVVVPPAATPAPAAAAEEIKEEKKEAP